MTYNLPIFGSILGVILANSQGTAQANGSVALYDTVGNLNPIGCNATNLAATALFTLNAHASTTGTATVDASAFFWPCNATGGAFAITLPTSASCAGRVYAFRKTDSSGNAVTITGAGSELINTANTYALSAQNNAAVIISDGTQWHVLAKF